MGWIIPQIRSSFLILLAGVLFTGDRKLVPSKSLIAFCIAFDFLILGIDQGIHGINNHCLNLLIYDITLLEDVVEDGGDIGQGFSGSRTGSNHKFPVIRPKQNSLLLVFVKWSSEYFTQFRVQTMGCYQFIHWSCRFECRIELHQRLRPELLLIELLSNEIEDARVFDVYKAIDVSLVVLH